MTSTDGLLRLLVGEDGRNATELKKILVEFHSHTNASAEKLMQSAVERGVLELGDNLKLVVSKKTSVFVEIAKKREAIETKQDELRAELQDLQCKCTHQGNLTYKFCGSSGNWDRDDSYWIEWRCHDCGKRWTASQDNSYDLTNRVYPNSTRVT